jgi:hypothetical protein
MASRTPSRSGRSGRTSSSSSGPNLTAMMFGGIGVVVVIVLIVVMSRGNGEAGKSGTADASSKSSAPTPPGNVTPSPSPAPTGTFAAKQGKPPARTAPPLPQSLLDQCRALLADAKKLSNEGVTLRNGGKNEEARAKQSAASDKIEEIKRLTKTHWSWQEEAELNDWALSAEYANLADLYTQVSKLDNQIRKGGGTR